MDAVLPYMLKSIVEYGIISPRIQEEKDSIKEIFVEQVTFEHLKKMAFDSRFEGIFVYSIRRGKEQIQVKNYVGLLETKDGFQLEILPKIEGTNVDLARRNLLKMLQTLHHPAFKQIQAAHLNQTQSPILEIFALVFLSEVKQLIQQGLGQAYLEKQSEERFIKGKLLVCQTLRTQANQAVHFQVKADNFSTDIPQNRLIKACVQKLSTQNFSNALRHKIQEVLFHLAEVNSSTNYEKDFAKIVQQNRLLTHYEKALHWAKIFLLNHSFSPFAGTHLNFALLFATERLFENYVATGFKKYVGEAYEVSLQNQEQHLIANHANSPKFRLRPDILLGKEDAVWILDTKWKVLDFEKKNYGIEQADLYQLYAYGKKFKAEKLFLIYPKNHFSVKPIALFEYEEHLPLHIIEFDIANNLADEINKFFIEIASPLP